MFAAGVHPEDLPTVEAAVARSRDPAGSGVYAAEYRVINRRDGRTRIVAATGRTTFENGRAVRLVGTVRDVTDKRAREAELAEAQLFAQSLVDTAPTLLYIFELKDQKNVYISPQILPMLGYESSAIEALGTDLFQTLFHSDDHLKIRDHHKKMVASNSDTPREIEYRMRHKHGSWRWMISKDRVYSRNAAGKPTQILGAALDVTERHQSDEQRELLIGELNHRVKNALAVVQSLAAMTLRTRCEPTAWEDFNRRLMAMANTQSVLAKGSWEAANLAEVVAKVLDAFAGGDKSRVSIDGPSVMIRANEAMTLSMVLHELATNAMKYGSLSSDKGTLSITWVANDAEVSLLWQEKGGPKVEQPSHAGFGSLLIGDAFSADGGQVNIDYHPGGLICNIKLSRYRTGCPC